MSTSRLYGRKKNRAIVSALWATFMKGGGAVSWLLMSVMVTRSLGAEEAGYYFLGVAIVTFLAVICRVGGETALIRFVGAHAAAGEWGAANEILKKYMIMVTAVAGIVATIVWSASPWIAATIFKKTELAPVLKAIAPGIVGLSLCFLLSSAFQAIHLVTLSVFAQSIGLALGVALISSHYSSSAQIAAGYSYISLLVLGASLLFWSLSRPAEYGEVSYRYILKAGIPLWIVAVVTAIQQWGGQFAAGVFSSSSDLAIFSVAQRMAVSISILLVSVNMVIAPRIAALFYKKQRDELRSLVSKAVTLITIVVAPIFIALMAGADWMMSVFGSEFERGANILRILAIGQFVSAISGPVGYLLTMSGHERDSRNIALITGPLSLLLAFSLTATFSITGAAVAASVSVASQNLIANYYVRKRLGFLVFPFYRAR